MQEQQPKRRRRRRNHKTNSVQPEMETIYQIVKADHILRPDTQGAWSAEEPITEREIREAGADFDSLMRGGFLQEFGIQPVAT